MATIITKNSQTASAVPGAASLSVGELAVNTADGKLYTEHTGGVVKEIIPSTVVDGGITVNKLATNAVTTIKIADANVTGAKLENSGVSAGTYGTGSAVPAITVDAKGRITSITTNAVAGGVTSLNGQTGAITNTALYAIGGYVIGRPPNTTNYTVNTTVAGSNLYATTGAGYYGCGWCGTSSQTFVNTGTWRCVSPTGSNRAGLWVRIS